MHMHMCMHMHMHMHMLMHMQMRMHAHTLIRANTLVYTPSNLFATIATWIGASLRLGHGSRKGI